MQKKKNKASDLFLLMFNLSQITSKEKTIDVFMAALSELWTDIKIVFKASQSGDLENTIPIGFADSIYGYLCIEHFSGLEDEDHALLQNACAMLALILKKIEQDVLLSDEKLHLQLLVKERTDCLNREIDERKQAEIKAKISEAETFNLLDIAEKSRHALLSLVEDERIAHQELIKLNEDLEERVIQRTAQLETSNKELEAFSYSVSHDLRAPLRALDGFSRILLEEYSSSLNAEGIRMLHIITDSSKKMGILIDDLLSFSHLSRQEIKMSQVNMYALANSVYQELIQSTKNNIEFRIQNIPEVYGDLSMMRQVWVNLISNAIKFTSQKAEPLIEIGNISGDTEIIYYVKDNGAGFDMTYSNKLFGVFQRLHMVKDFEGTGVGLAIVQRIVLRMNGRVWAEGKVNEGAVFYFALPAGREESIVL